MDLLIDKFREIGIHDRKLLESRFMRSLSPPPPPNKKKSYTYIHLNIPKGHVLSHVLKSILEKLERNKKLIYVFEDYKLVEITSTHGAKIEHGTQNYLIGIIAYLGKNENGK